MAKYYTWTEIREKIQDDMDIEAEVFIDETELLGYANEAIDEAEAEIHTLYEDYFLTSSDITLVQGQAEYALPSDIYGHKIRRIMYQNGATIYTVNRLKDWRKFEKKTVSDYYNTNDLYQYFVINSTVGTPQITITPAAKEAGNFMKMYYIRNANRMTTGTDVCDIPEFINFIFQYIKVRIYEKEGHGNLDGAYAFLERQRQLMTGTLTQMVADGDNEIEMDLEFYNEMS